MKTFYAFAVLFSLFIAPQSKGLNRVVANTNDFGPGSLRQTIADAAETGDSISFADGLTTIQLSSQLSIIAKNLTITGPITIRGNTPINRVFLIGNANVTIERLTIENGGVTGQTCGGGIQVVEAATLTARNSVFRNNRAPDGGAICFQDATGFIYSSTFYDNVASRNGGAIYANNSLRVENSTFFENSATSNGGAFFIDPTQGNGVVIASATLVANTAQVGGGIYYNEASSNVTLQNTLFVDDGDDGGNCGVLLSGTFLGSGNYGTDPTCVVSGASIRNANFAEFSLGDLQDNGGLTPTIALLEGSPAIDAGDTNAVGTYTFRDFDQRGEDRISPVDGQVDVGAYEFQQLVPICRPPLISCPTNKTFVRDDFGGQVVDFGTAVSSDCEIESVTCTQASGSTFANGVTTVTCTATDEEDNESSCSFTVTVAARGSDQCECPADGDTNNPDPSGVDDSDGLNINATSNSSGCNSMGDASASGLLLVAMLLLFGLWRVQRARLVRRN